MDKATRCSTDEYHCVWGYVRAWQKIHQSSNVPDVLVFLIIAYLLSDKLNKVQNAIQLQKKVLIFSNTIMYKQNGWVTLFSKILLSRKLNTHSQWQFSIARINPTLRTDRSKDIVVGIIEDKYLSEMKHICETTRFDKDNKHMANRQICLYALTSSGKKIKRGSRSQWKYVVQTNANNYWGLNNRIKINLIQKNTDYASIYIIKDDRPLTSISMCEFNNDKLYRFAISANSYNLLIRFETD